MANIITLEEAKTLGRPIGKVNDDKLRSYISEVENTIIRPAIGDALYYQIITADEEHPLPDNVQKLLDGGTYESECGCPSGFRMFNGLKVAEQYFVYSQNVMSGDFESTRYGMVIKNGDYSDHISSRERSDVYNSTTAIAKAYLNDCIAYCRAVGIQIQGTRNGNTTTGCIIHKIG